MSIEDGFFQIKVSETFEPEKYYYLFTNKNYLIKVLNSLNNESTSIKEIKDQIADTINKLLYSCCLIAKNAHFNDLSVNEIGFKDFIKNHFYGQYFIGVLAIIGDGLCEAFHQLDVYKLNVRTQIVGYNIFPFPLQTTREFLTKEHSILKKAMKSYLLPKGNSFSYNINKNNGEKIDRLYNLYDDYLTLSQCLFGVLVHLNFFNYNEKGQEEEEYFFMEDEDFDTLKDNFSNFLSFHLKCTYIESLLEDNKPKNETSGNNIAEVEEPIIINNTKNTNNIIELLHTKLFDAGYITVNIEVFKTHFGNNRSQIARISWYKDETEIAILFNFLKVNNFIANKYQFKLIALHFTKADGQLFNTKQLSTLCSKAKDIKSYPFIYSIIKALNNLVGSK